MRKLLAAILLAAAPAGAAAGIETEFCTTERWRDLESAMIALMPELLRATASEEGQRAAAFLAAHPEISLTVGFRRGDPRSGGASMLPNTVMEWDASRRRMLVAHWLLHRDGRDEAQLAASRDLLEDLLIELSPGFLHELSHAADGYAFEFYLPGFLEGEYVAFYREYLYVYDLLDVLGADTALRRARSERWRQLRTLERKARTSNAAFERGIRELYEGKPSIFEDHERWSLQLKRSLAAAERGADTPERRLRLGLMREDVDGVVGFLGDPRRIGPARAHYRKLLGELRAKLEARRGGAALPRPPGPGPADMVGAVMLLLGGFFLLAASAALWAMRRAPAA